MAKIFNESDGGDNLISRGLKNVNSFNVKPSGVTATPSGYQITVEDFSNYEQFNVSQTSASTDLVLLPISAPVGTVVRLYAVSAFTAKAGADASGLTINGAADTASIACPAGSVSVFVRLTSTNWSGTQISALGTSAGNGAVQFAEVSITNAEMLALRATPKTLVAAPGAGKVLEFISATLFFDYTGAYTETSDNLAVRYTGTSGTLVSQAIESGGFLDATADTMTNALAKIDTISAKTACDNQPLVLHNTGDGELGGGNAANAIRVRVAYRVVSPGW